jgi:hypothetical protein
MAEKSLPTRMYENVMGTPEQNAAAKKRMEERDKKNPESMPAKINKAAEAVTGKKAGGSVKRYSVGGTLKGMKDTYMEGVRKTGDDIHRMAGTEKGKQLDAAAKAKENRGIDLVKLMNAMDAKDRRDAGKSAAENTKQYGMKKGGMTASKRADGIAMRGKTRGKMV